MLGIDLLQAGVQDVGFSNHFEEEGRFREYHEKFEDYEFGLGLVCGVKDLGEGDDQQSHLLPVQELQLRL